MFYSLINDDNRLKKVRTVLVLEFSGTVIIVDVCIEYNIIRSFVYSQLLMCVRACFFFFSQSPCKLLLLCIKGTPFPSPTTLLPPPPSSQLIWSAVRDQMNGNVAGNKLRPSKWKSAACGKAYIARERGEKIKRKRDLLQISFVRREISNKITMISWLIYFVLLVLHPLLIYRIAY